MLRGLATNADVVIEEFSPGTTGGWGVDSSLRALNPD